MLLHEPAFPILFAVEEVEACRRRGEGKTGTSSVAFRASLGFGFEAFTWACALRNPNRLGRPFKSNIRPRVELEWGVKSSAETC